VYRGVGSWVGCGQCQGLSLLLIFLLCFFFLSTSEFNVVNWMLVLPVVQLITCPYVLRKFFMVVVFLQGIPFVCDYSSPTSSVVDGEWKISQQ